MKLTSVIIKRYNGKHLASLCEYNTETKTKQYISIPMHIASKILDHTTMKEIGVDCYCYRLLEKEIDPYYQD